MDTKKHSKMLMAAVLTAATYGVMTSAVQATLVDAIADSTATSYTVNEALGFTADAHALGNLVGEGRTLSIVAGEVNALSGAYTDEVQQKGSGLGIGSGQTASVSGLSISNFTTAFTVAGESGVGTGDAGILNITGVTFTGNTTDIANSGVVNFTGTNSINTMTGAGTSNVNSGKLTVAEGGSVVQSALNVLAPGRLVNNGTITAAVENRGANLENKGTISALDNYGFHAENNGTITNLTNEQSGTLYNYYGDNEGDEPAGVIGSLSNAGTVTNMGALSDMYPDAATIGNITANTGTVNNGGKITGNVTNNEGGYINNMLHGTIGGVGKTFTNEAGGAVLNYGTIASTVVNSGTITNQDDTEQAGTISGNVTNNAGGSINNTLGIISGNITNAAATAKIYAEIPDGGTPGNGLHEYAFANGTDDSEGYKYIVDIVNDTPVYEQLAAGYIISNADNLTGTITNNGNLTLTGGALKNIAGTGTTTLSGDITVTADRTINGNLNMGNGNTIDMQNANLSTTNPANVYTNDGAAFSTLTVGDTLSGTGNLKIDLSVVQDGGVYKNDKIVATTIAEDTVVNLTSVNVSEYGYGTGTHLDTGDTETYTVVSGTGATTNLTFNVGADNAGLGTITSDNHRYDFTAGDTPGTLDVSVRDTVATFTDFITGNINQYNDDPPAVTVNTYSLVNDYTTTTNLGTTANTYNPAVSELNLNLNNHTLSGQHNPTEYLGEDTYGADDDYVHISGAGDTAVYYKKAEGYTLENPVYELDPTNVIAGATVDSGYTLNVDGGTTGGTVSGFTTAFTTNAADVTIPEEPVPAGVLNINNVTFTGNTTDIANNGVVNFTGTNSVNKITGEGTSNVNSGSLTVNAGGSVEQDEINVGTATTSATLTNKGSVTTDEINVSGGGKLALVGSGSSTKVDEVNVNNSTVELTNGAVLQGNDEDATTVEFSGANNKLVLNANTADTELSGVIMTTDGEAESGYAVEANSTGGYGVTIDNAIADATSVTASNGTDLTLTKTTTDSISGYNEQTQEYNDSSENPQIVMGNNSSLTLDNEGEDSVINNDIVGAANNENGYVVKITDSTDSDTTTILQGVITGATDVNVESDTVIAAGNDDSTSDRIGNADLNLSDGAAAIISTTSDEFTIDNDVEGEGAGEELVLMGNAGTPGSASDSGTQFSIDPDATITDTIVDVVSGELLLPHESNLVDSLLAIYDGATLNTQGEGASEFDTPVFLDDGAQVKVDANAISGKTDSFNNVVQGDDDTAILTDVDVQDLDKVVHHTTKIDLKDGTGIDNLELSPELLDKKITAMTPIRKMTASFSEDGMLTILPSSGHNNYKDFNPAALATPIAAQLGGYLIQLNSYDEAFRNMDMYMLMTKKQRQALKFRNKLASIEGGNFVFDNTQTPTDSAAGWFRPYASFEKVGLHNGPKVENNMYGSFFGGESSMKDLGHGWDGLWGAYVGYNGAHQHYSNVSMYENGGTLGLVGMAYKDNFFVGGTINTGANAGEASTAFGSDDFTMLMAGVAAKAGYNWELADGKFVIQPSMVTAYTFVNTFDYTNSAGVRINSDPLNAIMIEPGLKFIGNLKNGWQPYAGVSVVINLMDKADMKANDISLPSMSVNPYVKYGLGVRKTWGERFTGFFQTFFMNGGRTGVGFQGGFRFAIGQDGSHSMSQNAGKAPELKKTQVNLSAMK